MGMFHWYLFAHKVISLLAKSVSLLIAPRRLKGLKNKLLKLTIIVYQSASCSSIEFSSIYETMSDYNLNPITGYLVDRITIYLVLSI